MHLHSRDEGEDFVSDDQSVSRPFVDPQLAASIEAWPFSVPLNLGDPNEAHRPSDDNLLPVCAACLFGEIASIPHTCQGRQSFNPEQTQPGETKWSPSNTNTLEAFFDYHRKLLESYKGLEAELVLERMRRIQLERDIRLSAVPQMRSIEEDDEESLGPSRMGSRQGGTASRGCVESVSLGTARSTTTHDDFYQSDMEEEPCAPPNE